MKKEIKIIILAWILAALVAAGIIGCQKVMQARAIREYNDYDRFKIIEEYRDGWELVDKDTGYGYFRFYGGSGTVPLFDEYGKPYTENGWRDRGT